MKMWIPFVLYCVSLLYLPSSCGADIPDVTTIYDVRDICRVPQPPPTYPPFGFDREDDHSSAQDEEKHEVCDESISGRVYKRTNALGLDLFLNEEKYESEVDEPGWSCDVNSTSECEFTGWEDDVTHSGIGTPIKLEQTYYFPNSFTVQTHEKKTSGHGIREAFLMVFTSSNNNIREQSYFHVMEVFRTSDEKSTFYGNCHATTDQNTWKLTDRDGRQLYMYCNSPHSEWNIHYTSTLKFEYETNGNVYLYFNESSSASMIWFTGSKMNYVYIYQANGHEGIMRINTPTPVKVSPQLAESSIVSPAFVPPTNRICLALVVNCSSDIKSNVLRISDMDVYKQVHVVHYVDNLKAGWQVKHVEIEINNKITTPIKLTIEKIYPVDVQVRRLSSCSSHGLEVATLPSFYVRSDFDMKDAPVYIATSEALPLIEKTADVSNSCMNGGVMTTAGCACPPGFTGVNCQTGCGRNKIGQDCGGSCSYRSRECEGYQLCSPFTGCKCAPGYQGYNCTTECSRGRYGNDCVQRCGHCAEGEPCDIFSGECSSCSFGYLPPYCKEEYVYYSLQPKLVSDKYKSISVSFDLQDGVKGIGEPKLYQVQYKEKGDTNWITHTIKTVPEAESDEIDSSTGEGNKIQETIDDLKVGTFYEVRVLLLDTSFNKYDGDLVRTARVLTKCDIPEEFDYRTTGSSNTSAFTFTWNYELGNENWCPVEVYEVSWLENGQRLTNYTNQPIYILTDFIPGFAIEFRVRAKTSGGYAPYSKTVKISTQHYGTSSVRDLKTTSSQSTAMNIAWRPPLGSEERSLKYKIEFKCVTQVACAPGCKDALEGQLTQEGTSVTLSALLPFTQYLVTVTPENGPQSKLYAGTKEAVPTEAPVLSNQTSVRSNSSITVFWAPVSVCSSFLKGYTYQLTKATESMKLLASGFTKDTSMSFYNLTASTDYVVKVFINTVAGWNPDVFLSINISTSATVPDAVQNLTVYKRGRTMLGLRWMEPKYLYGQLKSFTVQHSLGKDVIGETVEPTHCVVWPEYYCHTLENLKSNRKYNIMVSARNMDMPEDGAVASLTTTTKESAPLPPEDLKVLNSSSTSVSLQWKHPFLINGVLRSFVVNVEESEKFDQDSCCQDYPLVELQVKEEKEFYEVEVSGLHPASTYYLSVSAKTVSMGPSQSLVVYTRPPHLNITLLPDTLEMFEISERVIPSDFDWLPQENISEVNTSGTFSPLIRSRILLMTLNNTIQIPFSPLEAGIKDEQLLALLESHITEPFWFITEFNEEGLVSESEWGKKPLAVPYPDEEEYRFIIVQISDYNGVFNVDLRYSSPFN